MTSPTIGEARIQHKGLFLHHDSRFCSICKTRCARSLCGPLTHKQHWLCIISTPAGRLMTISGCSRRSNQPRIEMRALHIQQTMTFSTLASSLMQCMRKPCTTPAHPLHQIAG
jgi:hypothetical protein